MTSTSQEHHLLNDEDNIKLLLCDYRPPITWYPQIWQNHILVISSATKFIFSSILSNEWVSRISVAFFSEMIVFSCRESVLAENRLLVHRVKGWKGNKQQKTSMCQLILVSLLYIVGTALPAFTVFGQNVYINTLLMVKTDIRFPSSYQYQRNVSTSTSKVQTS